MSLPFHCRWSNCFRQNSHNSWLRTWQGGPTYIPHDGHYIIHLTKAAFSHLQGVIPMAMDQIFTSIGENPETVYLLRVSYVEIYNEKLNDLLKVRRWRLLFSFRFIPACLLTTQFFLKHRFQILRMIVELESRNICVWIHRWITKTYTFVSTRGNSLSTASLRRSVRFVLSGTLNTNLLDQQSTKHFPKSHVLTIYALPQVVTTPQQCLDIIAEGLTHIP